MYLFKRLLTLAFVALPLLAPLEALHAETADIVALNGRIYTVNPEQPWAEAIAIKGADIVYVGESKGAQAFIGPGTEVADLGGKLVLPGLVSGHEHPLLTAAVAAALYIEYSEDKQQMLDAVAAHLKDNPDGARWSFGGSYEGRVEIYRKDIDRITTEPFMMIAASGHGAWLNSAALQQAGLVKGKEMPIDGVELDAQGNPNGYLSTSAAAMYAMSQLGLIRKQDLLDNLPEVLALYNSYGLTTVQDAGQPPGSEAAIFESAAELEQRGELTLRIASAVMAQRPMHLEGAFLVLADARPKYRSERFKVNTLKIHGGSPDGHSAPLLEPYSDRPDYSGPEIFPYDVRLAATLQAAKQGINVHTHVMGDRSIREALDAFAAVREAGYDEVRLSTGHSSLVHPDDQPRYAELDVTCNIMAAAASVPEETTPKRIGKARMQYWFPNQSLAGYGTRISMSADAPTSPLNPWHQIEAVMLRKEPGQTEQLNPKQGLTLAQAIEAYTMGSAYQVGWEHLVGSLQTGKRADIIVLDQDLFEIEPGEIHKTNVLLTMVNGEVVHQEAVDWGSTFVEREFDMFTHGAEPGHSPAD